MQQKLIISAEQQLTTDPSAPPAGFCVLYTKTDGNWYYINSSGSIAQVPLNILTGFIAAAGTVVATDTILQALQKLAGNHDALSLTVNQKILSIAGNYSQSIM